MGQGSRLALPVTDPCPPLALAIASATAPYTFFTFTSAYAPLRLRNFFLFNHGAGEISRDGSISRLNGSRMTVCLVGGARRFELTGRRSSRTFWKSTRAPISSSTVRRQGLVQVPAVEGGAEDRLGPNLRAQAYTRVRIADSGPDRQQLTQCNPGPPPILQSCRRRLKYWRLTNRRRTSHTTG